MKLHFYDRKNCHPMSPVTIKAANVSTSSNTFTRQEIFTLEDAFRGRCKHTHRGAKVTLLVLLKGLYKLRLVKGEAFIIQFSIKAKLIKGISSALADSLSDSVFAATGMWLPPSARRVNTGFIYGRLAWKSIATINFEVQ